MKNPELFHKTIGILVKAYQNDTLFHADCSACAVGNIVASNLGIDIEVINKDIGICGWSYGVPYWSSVFSTDSTSRNQISRPNLYRGMAKYEIDSTGYTWQELAKIEYAFESVEFEVENSDQHQFDGLMAVVDALMIIHEANEEEVKEAKLLFVK